MSTQMASGNTFQNYLIHTYITPKKIEYDSSAFAIVFLNHFISRGKVLFYCVRIICYYRRAELLFKCLFLFCFFTYFLIRSIQIKTILMLTSVR
jgi:hypothetical protein